LGLQWGHDFAAVEITLGITGVVGAAHALQWGHDFAAVEMAAYFRPLLVSKNGPFSRGWANMPPSLMCANVFTGVFEIKKRFERFPVLPEPHNLSKKEVIN